MKKKLAKLLVSALVLPLLLGLTTAHAAGDRMMRIGLSYGDSTRAACVLHNVTNSGFRMGYYDGDLDFVSLAWTGETSVAVLITQNLYLKSGGSYSTSADGNRGAVGCYHVHLPGSYDDFDSALAAAEQVSDGFVAWVDGSYCVRSGSYTRRADAEEAAASCGVDGAALGETSGYGYSVVAAGTTRILFQFDADKAGESGALGILPGLEEGDAVTSCGDYKYRGGFRFERIGGGSSTIVNMVNLEDYVRGIIPYEMSASWPLEALKAQSVCARTYALYHANRHSSNHFDLCTTTHCHVYRGTGSANANSDQAVAETAGLLARYNGKMIDAVYYSSNGGASEDAKNVWGSDLGYLKGKLDPYEADIESKAGNYHWSVSGASVQSKLTSLGYNCGQITDITTKRSAVGNVIEITIKGSTGKSFTFSRDKIRSSLGLNSIRFTVERSGGSEEPSGYAIAGRDDSASGLDGLYALGGDGSVTALPEQSYILTADGVKALEPVAEASSSSGGDVTFTLRGTGWGHNVGLSQWGAYAMAKRGYTYDQILKFYYTDITIE